MTDAMIDKTSKATYQSFETIITAAIEREIDFFLVSGDIYDSEQRSLKGQWFFRKQALRLQQENIPLYVIHGNHDPLVKADGIIQMPDNVHIFSSADVSSKYLETKNREEVYIYGFSYPEKAYMKNPVPKYQKISNNNAYHIGMLHGQESGQRGHDPYAPFTLSELKEKEFDYWALGHVHQRQVLVENPPAIYPGNIQGCHRKESGGKGAYVVELTKAGASFSFLNSTEVVWEEQHVSINGLNTIDQLFDAVGKNLNSLETVKITMVTLRIQGEGLLHSTLTDLTKKKEVSNLLIEEYSSDCLMIEKLIFQTSPSVHKEKWREQEHLIGDIIRTNEGLMEDSEFVRQRISLLYNHRNIRKYLEDLSDSELREVIEEAEKILLTTLIEEETL